MDTFRLRDGIEVAIRPIRPDDGPLISAAYERPRYERFLVPKPYMSAAEVEYLVDIDRANHLALVATLLDDPERVVGVARLVRVPEEPQAAEFAVVIVAIRPRFAVERVDAVELDAAGREQLTDRGGRVSRFAKKFGDLKFGKS